jgi:hypothetical protein
VTFEEMGNRMDSYVKDIEPYRDINQNINNLSGAELQRIRAKMLEIILFVRECVPSKNPEISRKDATAVMQRILAFGAVYLPIAEFLEQHFGKEYFYPEIKDMVPV